MNTCDFLSFPKIPRLAREVVVTEKIDGTNAQILIVPASEARGSAEAATVIGDALDPNAVTIFAGSRTRWIQPGNDNYGFAAWVRDNAVELAKLGPGRHFGEWWGGKIQRGYGIKERRFSLFNVSRWLPRDVDMSRPGVFRREEITGSLLSGPDCCHVVPTIWRGVFDTAEVEDFLSMLRHQGSFAQPGFMNPEGVVVFHVASGSLFKRTCDHDESPKSIPEMAGKSLTVGVPGCNSGVAAKILAGVIPNMVEMTLRDKVAQVTTDPESSAANFGPL